MITGLLAAGLIGFSVARATPSSWMSGAVGLAFLVSVAGTEMGYSRRVVNTAYLAIMVLGFVAWSLASR